MYRSYKKKPTNVNLVDTKSAIKMEKYFKIGNINKTGYK